jgi:AcrR family transcriptional regulator
VDIESEKPSTKQRIVDSAIELFARKGYTESTIRELAGSVGIKEASLYNHFPSKNAILEYILEDYSNIVIASCDEEKLRLLKDTPSADGFIACLKTVFPKGREEYYLKELYVILQEQHRNPIVRKFVTDEFILRNEQVIKKIINTLKEYGVLKPETDPDFWAKTHSSLLYSFASRHMMGIGDNKAEFEGRGMTELLRNMYDLLFITCGVSKI